MDGKPSKEEMMTTRDIGIQTDPDTVHNDASNNDDNDSDYIPCEDEYEDDDDDDYEDEEDEDDIEEEEEHALEEHPNMVPFGHPPPMVIVFRTNKRERTREGTPEEDDTDEEDAPTTLPTSKRARIQQFMQRLTAPERKYFRDLPDPDKEELISTDLKVRNHFNPEAIPLRFKILESDMHPSCKTLVLSKLDQFQRMHEGGGEYFKLRNWLNAVTRIPFGTYNKIPVKPSDPTDKIAEYLQGVRKSLDKTVFGHSEAKDQILRIFAQWVTNPSSNGHCIGIQGPPGIGKTSLVKDGICKALGVPFGFVALGGANDGSFLEGHGFTYEGSTYGKIVEILMKTQVMNPIFFFDELDKVSQTRRGEEVTGILTHLTDITQNERFNDRYFGEMDLDISKALIVFSYNDESLINPILKDRMITIRVKGYTTPEKLIIARDYLIPSIFQQYHLKEGDIMFPPEILERIIETIEPEEGVRNLKRAIESIVSWLNMLRYVPDTNDPVVEYPVSVTKHHLKKYLKKGDHKHMSAKDIQNSMYI